MSEQAPSLKATDLLAVKSRVSWGAIGAGAMVALAIYFFLTLLGLAIGLEVASRRAPGQEFAIGAAIYSVFTLLFSMFLGGWSTSRLAVGETKLEAVLYGVILWGVLFLGMFWLIGAGVRVGFGALVSGAVVVNSDNPAAATAPDALNKLIESYNSEVGGEKFVADLTKTGVDEAQAKKIQASLKEKFDKIRNPASVIKDPGAIQAGLGFSRQAAWFSLAGVAISMMAVIVGSLMGSGDLPVPVPVLGVRRRAVDPRV
jgi:ABC-type transport system involved in multi-copper enzyme maturation permease subunit